MDDEALDAVRQIFDADEPVVIRVRHELQPFQERLLVALGAGWVVDPVHGERCPLPCGWPECGVSAAAVNRDVRVEAGEGGTVVVMSAYCSKCRTGVMPRDDGSCSWCGTVIVDEDSLPIKEMLAQIEERGTAGPGHRLELVEGLEEAPAAGAAAGTDGVSSSPARMRGGAGSSPASDLWPRDRITDAIRAHAARTGFVPVQRDFLGPTTNDRPNMGLVKRAFGSWGNAIEEAGFPRPHRGGKPVAIADLEGSGREPRAETERTPLVLEQAAVPAADDVVVGQPSRPDNDRGRTTAWTRDEIVAAIKRWADEHGQPPVSSEWTPRVDGYPPVATVAKHFGSWAGGIEAAGFPRPTRGGLPNPGSQQPPARVRVNGTGLSYRSPDEAYVAADEIEADGERVADQARFDGNEAKAEQARDRSRELAEKIRAAAAAFEGRNGHASPAYEKPAEPLPEPTADATLHTESAEPELLVKPDEMPPGQRAFARSLIAGLRAFADTLERQTEDPA